MSRVWILLSAALLFTGCCPVPEDFPALNNLAKFCTHVEGTAGVDDFNARSSEGIRCESGESEHCWVQTTDPYVRIHFPEKKTTSCTNADPAVDSCRLEYELFKLEQGCGEVEIDIEGAEGGYIWGSFTGTLCHGADSDTDIEGKFSAYSEE